MKSKKEILWLKPQVNFGNVNETPQLYIKEVYAEEAMEEYSKYFAQWLSENTETIREEKITLYRYHDGNDEWGNYTLDDIYTVFEEEMNK